MANVQNRPHVKLEEQYDVTNDTFVVDDDTDLATKEYVDDLVSSSGTEYTAGTGIDITGDVISSTVDISGKQGTLAFGKNLQFNSFGVPNQIDTKTNIILTPGPTADNVSSAVNYSFISTMGGAPNSIAGDQSIIGGVNIAVGSGTQGNVVWGNSLTLNSGCNFSIVGGQSNTVASVNDIVGGGLNTVNGAYNLVSGSQNTVATSFNIVGGNSNEVSGGVNSLVIGSTNTISGPGFVLVGGQSNTVSGGEGALVGGQSNTVIGFNTLTVGSNNNNNALNGVVYGEGNLGTENNSLVGGKYCKSDTSLFKIGNGISAGNRSNAFAVTAQGESYVSKGVTCDFSFNINTGATLTIDTMAVDNSVKLFSLSEATAVTLTASALNIETLNDGAYRRREIYFINPQASDIAVTIAGDATISTRFMGATESITVPTASVVKVTLTAFRYLNDVDVIVE